MNTKLRFGQLHLVAWLGLSHLLATTVGVLGMWQPWTPLSPGVQAVAVMLAGAALGLLLNGPVLRAVESLTAALERLAQGKPIAPLPVSPRRLQPLHGLLALVDVLAGRERELAQMREDLVRSIGQAAAQAERNRLARDLHDSIKQQLYAINVSAAAALARWESDLSGARAAVEEVRRAAQAALAEMAALLQQLRPAPLAAAGLLDALREQCEALTHRTGAAVTVDLGEPEDAAAYTAAVDTGRLAPGAEEAIYRIAQEALNNIARHARASHVALRLRVADEALRLEIADDGQGFAADEHLSADRMLAGYGLAGMRDRAAGIGAALDVTSAPGSGTRVTLRVPLGQPAAQQEEALNAELKALAQKASNWEWAAIGAGLLALTVAQGFVPRLIGESVPPIASAVGALLFLGSVLAARLAWNRARRATLAVTLMCGADSAEVWRLRREAHQRRTWVGMLAVLWMPGLFVPKTWPQYSISALTLGAAWALFVTTEIVRYYRATEACWQRLSVGALAAELDQAWRQRWGWLSVPIATAAGFLVYRYGRPMASLTWPPSADLVLDLMVVVYLGLTWAWIIVNYRLLRFWRTQLGSGGPESVTRT